MLEKLYTTKMSDNKKAIERRFSEILRKNRKTPKIISSITAIFLSFVLLSGYAAMAVLDPNEEIKEEYVLSLIDYEILKGYPDGKMRLDEPITNAEAITIILRAHKGYRDMLETYIPKGESENHWAYKEIALAKDLKIADSDMVPDEIITVSGFSKMLVLLLGYGVKAEQRGGDYVSVAKRPGILDGLDKDAEDILTRKDAALMLSNALDVPFMEASSYNAEIKTLEYVIKEGNTLRSLLD